MASNAVPQNNVSAINGYALDKGDFGTVSPNLTPAIAIFGEANHANQSSIGTAPFQITSARQAAEKYGFGSPIHMEARILFPVNGGGASMPVFVLAQAEDTGAEACVKTITVSGTATATGTHYVRIAGRTGIDGTFYSVNIVKGDSAATIAGKVNTAINNVLSSPVSSTVLSAVVTASTKWYGNSANGLTIEVDTNNNTLGVSYVIATDSDGVGDPTLTASLAAISSNWLPIIVNTYGLETDVIDAFEVWNGIPDPTNATGRYTSTIFKPAIVLSGSVEDDPSSVTDSSKNQLTISVCPAPLSLGFQFEAAANVALLFATTVDSAPQTDIIGKSLPDMPLPSAGDIPLMQSYTERDRIVKKGCSTVQIIGDSYQVVDFVTTYHPDGEVPPQFRYCRDLFIDFNIEYGYRLLEIANCTGKTLISNGDITTASNVISPSDWKALVYQYIDSLVLRALITDAKFSQNSVVVGISSTNPNRLNTEFSYKRTGTTRILSTTVKAGFNFGNN